MQTRRRIIVYVDGFNLYFRRLRNTPFRWLNLAALFKQKFADDDVVAVRYFTARVGGKFDPLKPVRQQAYLRALESTPLVQIHYGNFLHDRDLRVAQLPEEIELASGKMVRKPSGF